MTSNEICACGAATGQIPAVVERLESCEYGKGEFTHALHLTVAAWYLLEYGFAGGLERMRNSLQRLLGKLGVSGYNETMTQFWLRMVESELRKTALNQPFSARAEDVVAKLGDKEILFRYYSRGRVMSEAAKSGWLEPDLRSLDSSAS